MQNEPQLRKNLPLAKNRNNTEILLPSQGSLEAGMQLLTTPETAEYLLERYTERLRRAGKLEEGKDVLERIARFVEYIKKQTDRPDDAFYGREILSDLKNFHINVAEDAFETLETFYKDTPIIMDFAVKDGELLRGFSADGQKLATAGQQAIDELFNACLIEHGLLSKGSVIYRIDEQGKIVGKVNDAEIQKFIEQDFASYLENRGFSLTTRAQRFPTKVAEEAKVTEGVKATVPKTTPEVKTPIQPDTTPGHEQGPETPEA